MTGTRSTRILEEYDEKIELYHDFTFKVLNVIEDLLDINDVSIHSVRSRIKEREIVSEKIKKKEGRYNNLEDITDISGIRIITYFAEDVDQVAEIIESEFVIDHDNSVDRREIMKSDKFGYLSLHYIVSLSEPRLILSENRRFRECKAEIQIRSILQHAWAEIEHDLGYKTELEIPHPIRRRFTRIAGLLEIADTEFDIIRARLDEYQKEVGPRIIEKPTGVLINKLSLTLFIKENPLVRDIAQTIAENHSVFVRDFISVGGPFLKELNILGIKTISDLETSLSVNRDLIIRYASRWFSTDDYPFPDSGISAITLDAPVQFNVLILMAQTGSRQKIIDYLELGRNPIDKEKYAERILSTYNP